MKELKKLEVSLGKVFAGFPNISNQARESVAKALPIIALVFGIFQLAAAYWVFKLANVVNQVDNLLRSYSVLNGSNVGLSGSDKTLIYLGALVLLVDAVILLMAYKPLSERKRKGWELLFLGSLLNVAYSVVSLFITGRGFGSFLAGLIGSGLGFWILFQVNGKYGGKQAAVESNTETEVKVGEVKKASKPKSKAKK
jgi:uncharacterized membrane protein YvlD (DUF360 family)